jgi:hypothetical protein
VPGIYISLDYHHPQDNLPGWLGNSTMVYYIWFLNKTHRVFRTRHALIMEIYATVSGVAYIWMLPTSLKKNDTADNLLLKDRKRKTDIMNSQRTKQHICKPHKPTHDRSLQKSCFLADAPPKFDTFVI